MIFDGCIDVGCREGARETARECVEVAHFGLALPRDLELLLQLRGQMAGHDRHEQEQREIDVFLRVPDLKAVDRRKEEVRRRRDTEKSRHDRRNDAPARRRNHHRYKINDGAPVNSPLRNQRVGDGRGDAHDQDGGAQFAEQLVVEAGFQHGRPIGLHFTLRGTTIRQPTLVCLCFLR